MKVVGSRPRKYLQEDASQVILIIRRLRCLECNKIHHELPDILVPYKRYKSECIETVVAEDNNTPLAIACDESTLHRWKKWFKSLCGYFAGCLQSIAIQLGKETEEASGVLPKFKEAGLGPGHCERLWAGLLQSFKDHRVFDL